MSKTLDRIADASGLVFLLFVGVGYAAFVAPFSPPSLESPDQVMSFLNAHAVDWRFGVGLTLEFVGLLALLVFATRLAGRIRAVDRPDGWAAAAVVSIAALSAAVKVASFGPGLIGRQHYQRYDTDTVTAMFDLNDAAYDLSWALDGMFLLLLGSAALALGGMPRWLSGWALIAGVAIEIGIVMPALFDTLQLVFLLWLVAASIWSLRHPTRSRAATDPSSDSEVTAVSTRV
jgi:hypothetical protein